MYSLLCPWTINLTAGYRKGKATSKRGFLRIGKVTCILFVTIKLQLFHYGLGGFPVLQWPQYCRIVYLSLFSLSQH